MGALALAGYCRHRTNFHDEEAYVAVKGNEDPTEDFNENLTRSAEMYAYQEAKANIIAKENAKRRHEMRDDTTDESEQESDQEGDTFVYELPGMAAPGDMNVPNPLFDDSDRVSTDEEFGRRYSSQSYASSRGSYRGSPETHEDQHRQ